MNRIAIIPARAGSKRIPDKNILPLSNKPLLFWAIDVALETKMFDRIIVSTDSEYYAELAKSRGIECPFLRNKYYDDNTNVSQATTYSLMQAKDFYDENFSTVVQLMPNCPLRKVNTIKEFIFEFEAEEKSSLISAFEFGWMNPNWAYELNKEGYPKPLFPKRITERSQDLPKLYCPSGAIWVTSQLNLLKYKKFYTPGWKFKIIPWDEAIDIDDSSDFEMAETLCIKKNIFNEV